MTNVKEEIEALKKRTEQNRAQLEKAWQKVENLDAAIQTARRTRRRARESNSKPHLDGDGAPDGGST